MPDLIIDVPAGQKLGIENIEKVLTAVLNIGTDLADSFSDGVQWTDAIGLIKEFSNIRTVVETAPQALEEFKDLSPEESEELANGLCDQFDIANDDLEAKIETITKLISRTYRFAWEGKDLFDEWKSAIAL